MDYETTKKKWGLPSLCVIDSKTGINGGGANSTAEINATGLGIYTALIGGIPVRVGKTTYTQAHS